MRFAEGHRTDVGRGRPENEDNLLVDRDLGLYAVADGMGGHRAGEVASATAIETLQVAYRGGQRLDQAMVAANAAVFAKAADDPSMRGMGTTLTAIAVDDGTALLGHVGDSRAYLMRDGAVTQVTDDHSLVEQLVREGRLSPAEAQNHPQRAIITRALGVDPDVQVDTYRIDLRPGDRLLICSDGLTNMLSDDTIAGTLRRHADPQQAADTLVDMANQAGGDDNITVVILDALADGGGAAASAGAAATADAPVGADTQPPEPRADVDAMTAAPAGEDVFRGTDHRGGFLERRLSRSRSKVRGVRALVLWGLPVLAAVGIAIGALGWYARRTYYVGLSGDRVTLFRGVPGGLLGWDPTVERQTALTAGDLTPADRADLESGHRFASRTEANRFIALLEDAHATAAGTTTTSGPPPPAPAPPPPAPATTETTEASR